MPYARNTLARRGKSYVEVKMIHGRPYSYLRWVETNGGTMRRRSKYLGAGVVTVQGAKRRSARPG